MLPMHPLLFPPRTTRHKVARTGARLAYAPPTIAFTLDLPRPARADRSSPSVCPQNVFACGARDHERYRCASDCFCYPQLSDATVCAHEDEGSLIARCDDETPCAAGLVCVASSCRDRPVCLTPCAA